MLDCIVLTDHRYVDPPEVDWYIGQVLSEDGAVVDALRAAGLTVARKAWDDPEVDWSGTRSVLFRSTWDYFDRWPEFARWLATVRHQTRLFNAAELVHWNLDKRYLLELDRKGIRIVPTLVADKGDVRSLADLVAPTGWSEAVAKPVVSGAGRETFRVPIPVEPEHSDRWARLVAAEDMLVQPFLPSILDRGEISLVAVDGEITHAVRKIAAPGEFRVQDDHGGTVVAYEPDAAEVGLAREAVAAVQPSPLYARVDIAWYEGAPAIMELELVEPELFFRFGPAYATERLASALRTALDSSSSQPAHTSPS